MCAYFRFGLYPRDLTSVGSRHTPALASGVECVKILLVEAVGGDTEGFAVAYRLEKVIAFSRQFASNVPDSEPIVMV